MVSKTGVYILQMSLSSFHLQMFPLAYFLQMFLSAYFLQMFPSAYFLQMFHLFSLWSNPTNFQSFQGIWICLLPSAPSFWQNLWLLGCFGTIRRQKELLLLLCSADPFQDLKMWCKLYRFIISNIFQLKSRNILALFLASLLECEIILGKMSN